MAKFAVTLNINDHTMNDDQWNLLASIYEELDGWMGYSDEGIPYWFNINEAEEYISTSLEPSGLVFSAFIREDEEWFQWMKKFESISSEKLGFKVKDAEL